MKALVLAILGPTASGKTALAVQLAQALKAEVISADSRQFYQEMRIGTARPSISELAGVPHHFLGSHSIHAPLSAGAYEREALPLLENLLQRHVIPIVSGGSGLFVKALLEGLDDLPSDPSLRQLLQQRLDEEGLAVLQQILRKADPLYYASADVQNPVRVLRALELIQITGQTIDSLHGTSLKVRDFDVFKVAIAMPRALLYQRINLRVDQMMERGLLDEVQQLMPYRHLQALQTVGYTELFDHLDGKHSLQEAVHLIKRNTRRYAKRQLTWLRKDAHLQWYHADEVQQVLEAVKSRLHSAHR